MHGVDLVLHSGRETRPRLRLLSSDRGTSSLPSHGKHRQLPASSGRSNQHTCQLLQSWSRDTWDRMWFRPQWSRSEHCEGEALAFLGGSGGMHPRKNLKSETVKYAFFNVLVNDSTHLLQEKNRPKNVHSFLRSKENYRRMKNLNALYYTDFLFV